MPIEPGSFDGDMKGIHSFADRSGFPMWGSPKTLSEEQITKKCIICEVETVIYTKKRYKRHGEIENIMTVQRGYVVTDFINAFTICSKCWSKSFQSVMKLEV